MEILAQKTCRACGTTKALAEFYPRKGSPDGYRNGCRDCVKAAVNARYDPVAAVANNAARYARDRDSINAARRSARAMMTDDQRRAESQEKAAYLAVNREMILATKQRYRIANRDKLAAKNKAWNEANADYVRATKKAYHIANREARRVASAKWYADNAERAAQYRRERHVANRESIRAYNATYRVAKPHIQAAAIARRSAARAMVLNIAPTNEQMAHKMAYWGNKCWMCLGSADTVDHVKPLSKFGPHVLANFRPACRQCNSRKHAKWFGPHELSRFKSK